MPGQDLELASRPNGSNNQILSDSPNSGLSSLPLLPADYELPPVVKCRVDGNYQLANAVAIVSTLFAAVMIGVGQIITPPPEDTIAWEAVVALTYSSVIANLASAMCALWVMAMCSDVPQKAQFLVISNPESWPARVRNGEGLTQDLIRDDYDLLTAFGMYRSYPWMEYGEILWLIIGLMLMFAAIMTWSWVSQSRAVAGVILAFIVPALLFALYPLWFMIAETYREHRKSD